MLSNNNRDLPKEEFEKPSTPLINVQNSCPAEETYYGNFRSIVKQRYFGIKLEEDPFMEFIDQNQEIKDKLSSFIDLMVQVKNDYIGFLKKNYPDKIEKRKRKRKAKKKGFDLLDVPRDSDAFSSDYSGLLSPSSRDDIDTVNESQHLKTKIENIKKDFSFESIENVAKNIHLFDDLFGKLKADHTKSQQLNQLRQLGLVNFGVGAAAGGVSFAFLGNNANNESGNAAGVEQLPDCFEYFNELYTRWDIAIEETETGETNGGIE